MDLLRDVKWFDDKHKSRMYMKGATSDQPIVPEAEGKLRVKAITRTNYNDLQCYYLTHFTSTLLSDCDLLRSSTFAKDFSGQILTKYFELNNEVIQNDLKHKGRVNLNNNQQYHMDYSTCTLTCIHKKLKRFDIEIPGIIFGGLCYTLPIEVPDQSIDHPRANLFNCSQLMYEGDKKFQKNVMNCLLRLSMKYNNNNILLSWIH